MARVAVVTGSNQGIGLWAVKGLSKQFDGITYLTARNVEAGQKAVEELKKEGYNNVHFHQLDVTDKNSIATFKSYLQSTYGGIDILVNNAGIMIYSGTSGGTFGEEAEVTMNTNYFGLLEVSEQLFPLLRSHARVVNVASALGTAYIGWSSEERRKQFLACTTVEDVHNQMKEFLEQAKADTHEQHGWPHNTYAASKVGVILLSKIQQANIDKDPSRQDIVINACCPGYCATNMNRYRGPLTAEDGAKTLLYCALLPADVSSPRGEFVSKNAVQSLTFYSDYEFISDYFVRKDA